MAGAEGRGGVVGLESVGRDDTGSVGGKAAGLGEMLKAGLPVPPGFVVTAEAYLGAMADGGARDELRRLFAGVMGPGLASGDGAGGGDAGVAAAAGTMRDLVGKAGMPDALRSAVLEAFHDLGPSGVAVRCRHAEDTAGVFAGMHARSQRHGGRPGRRGGRVLEPCRRAVVVPPRHGSSRNGDRRRVLRMVDSAARA